MLAAGLLGLRHRLGRLFDDDLPPTRATHVFHIALATLIVVNVSGVILESVDAINLRFGSALWWLEQVSTTLFGIEYVTRAWVCVEIHHGQYRHPLCGRLRYLRSFFALIDLAAILPAVLGLLGAGDLRTLRLLRLLRMLKLTRHAQIFELLWAVFREEARSIGALLFILTLTLTISASLMYMIEGEAQPDGFSSIPAAMWWAIETLTTVGYGDLVPTTVAGKILGGMVTIIGVSAVALFTSVITVSFMDQLRLRRETLQHEVEARLAEGSMIPGELGSLELLGERLGLPEADTAQTIEDAARSVAVRVICPHCGTLLTDIDAT